MPDVLGTRAAEAVAVGIDMGGSSTRARTELDGEVLEGTGGPANVHAIRPEELVAAVTAATRGMPTPTHVAVCAAGAGSAVTRDRVRALVEGVFPGALVEVYPDFSGALALTRDLVEVTVVVGTGSVVCSEVDEEPFMTGGAGWILGDPGSAADLGQSLLRRYFEAPREMPADITSQIVSALGIGESGFILRSVHLAKAPAVELAKVAPVLTRLAADGVPWAVACVRESAASLARGVAYHLRCRALDSAQIGLLGGVWASRAFHDSFVVELGALAPGSTVRDLHDRQPVEGALLLARGLVAAPA